MQYTIAELELIEDCIKYLEEITEEEEEMILCSWCDNPATVKGICHGWMDYACNIHSYHLAACYVINPDYEEEKKEEEV